MSEIEQRFGGTEKHAPTEAEKVLSNLPDFEHRDQLWGANNEKDEGYQSRLAEIIELFDDEERASRIVEDHDTYDDGWFEDVDDYGNQLPFFIEMLEDTRKTLSRLSEENSAEYREAKEIMMDTTEVRDAIENTIEQMWPRFQQMCEQRTKYGVGSIYEGISNAIDMQKALRSAHWRKAEHPGVIPGFQAYKTEDIKGGRSGLLKIAELPDDAIITASDPEGAGKVSVVISGQERPQAKETWLITGKKKGQEFGQDFVFAFLPGEPVGLTTIKVKNCSDGTRLSKAQAMALGFEVGKIIAES